MHLFLFDQFLFQTAFTIHWEFYQKKDRWYTILGSVLRLLSQVAAALPGVTFSACCITIATCYKKLSHTLVKDDDEDPMVNFSRFLCIFIELTQATKFIQRRFSLILLHATNIIHLHQFCVELLLDS